MRTNNPRITIDIGLERKEALNNYIMRHGNSITWLVTTLLDSLLKNENESKKIILRKAKR